MGECGIKLETRSIAEPNPAGTDDCGSDTALSSPARLPFEMPFRKPAKRFRRSSIISPVGATLARKEAILKHQSDAVTKPRSWFLEGNHSFLKSRILRDE